MRRKKKTEKPRRKSQESLQIKTVKENPRRKSSTFKPPNSDDFQNAADKRDYIHWLLGVSTGNTVESESILTADAINILATKLRTPLQVQLHLTLALEAGYQTGEKPVTVELVEAVMSCQFDDLEPTLARHSYRLKDMVEQFDAKASEIRALFSNQLEPKRTAEIRERMLAAGLPI